MKSAVRNLLKHRIELTTSPKHVGGYEDGKYHDHRGESVSSPMFSNNKEKELNIRIIPEQLGRVQLEQRKDILMKYTF